MAKSSRQLAQLTDGSVRGNDGKAVLPTYNTISWPTELGTAGGDIGTTGIRYPHICAFFINENVKDSKNGGKNFSRGGTTSEQLNNGTVANTTNNVITNRISNSGFSTTTGGVAGGVGKAAAAAVGAVTESPNVTAAYGSGLVDLKKVENAVTSSVAQFIVQPYKRLNLAIFLPMPMEVKHDYGVIYKDAGMEGALGTALTAFNNEGFTSALASGGEALVRGAIGKLVADGATFLNMGDSGKQIFNRALGSAENPRTEQVFEGVAIREFQFRWQFWPKSEKESDELKTILELFKENMLPSFRSDDNVGGFYTMPNEFDIEFYTSELSVAENGQTNENFRENPHIPRISTCVLTNIMIDSTPKGQFAAFAGTGAPVTTAVVMTFKELSPLHRGMVGRGIQIGKTRAGGH